MTTLFSSIYNQLCSAYDKQEAKALARIVIEDVLDLSFTRVLAGLDSKLTSEQNAEVDNVVTRLLHHEPIQYITGTQQFCGLPISVNPKVLIPRPETEQLVSIATSLFADSNDISVMDACTGSGCIALAIKHERPDWHVEGCDISGEAVATARYNATINDIDVDFMLTDILSDNTFSTKYDLLVSNPPYVMEAEKAAMSPNVLDHEPPLALFVSDSNPLVFYTALARWGRKALNDNGCLLVEINHLLASQTSDLFISHNYTEVNTINDCFDKPRFILCRK